MFLTDKNHYSNKYLISSHFVFTCLFLRETTKCQKITLLIMNNFSVDYHMVSKLLILHIREGHNFIGIILVASLSFIFCKYEFFSENSLGF